MEKDMNIQDIEKVLGARYVGSYESGHVGSRIMRFARNDDDIALVVKFAFNDNTEAMADTKSNLDGYSKIAALGAPELVPPELSEIQISDGRAIVMKDLGASMRQINGGVKDCIILWNHFKSAVVATVSNAKTEGEGLPFFAEEILKHIDRFSNHHPKRVTELIRKADWSAKHGKSAIMLLDFTPDNIFVSQTSLSFIDPWSQDSFLGHPAVSVGQLVTLMQVYDMKQADEAVSVLKEKCMTELPSILECDTASIELAYQLGVTLQYVLSSYVRKDTEPAKSVDFYEKACQLWQ